jgi:hypothetical protein
MINAEISAHLSTLERTSHHTTPNRARPQGRLRRRLAGPGWVIMTLACRELGLRGVCVAVTEPPVRAGYTPCRAEGDRRPVRHRDEGVAIVRAADT